MCVCAGEALEQHFAKIQLYLHVNVHHTDGISIAEQNMTRWNELKFNVS